MELNDLEKAFSENDNIIRGPCSLPEPDELDLPVRADFMDVVDLSRSPEAR
jgi:hypothetical protein